MKNNVLNTLRLQFIPITLSLAEKIRDDVFFIDYENQIVHTDEWPDNEFLDLLPKIISQLDKTGDPNGFTSYLILEKAEHTVIGDAGFKSPPDKLGEVNLGYGLIESKRKKGYATEAAQALVNWAFQHQEVKAITANCYIGNEPSVRLLEKLGAKKLNIQNGLINWRLDKYDV